MHAERKHEAIMYVKVDQMVPMGSPGMCILHPTPGMPLVKTRFDKICYTVFIHCTWHACTYTFTVNVTLVIMHIGIGS